MLYTTPPLTIIDFPADANHLGGERRYNTEYIIIHATVGGLKSSLEWLTTKSQGRGRVSVHRLIDKNGDIYKLVEDDHIAWHAGNGVIGPTGLNMKNLNDVSLGIELVNLNDGRDLYPDEQMQACVLQCLEWLGLYPSIKGILGHTDVDIAKSDPKGFDWVEFRRRLDIARVDLVGGSSTMPPNLRSQLGNINGRLQGVVQNINDIVAGLG